MRLALWLAATASCLAIVARGAAQPAGAIIPAPQKMEFQPGIFQLQPGRRILGLFPQGGTKITADAAGMASAEYLAQQLRRATGFTLAVTGNAKHPAPGAILLTTEGADSRLGDEGYHLSVTPAGITVRAPQSAGLFYGAQTLLKLFPPEIFSTNAVTGVDWSAPCVEIDDWPRFKWRGFMFDCSRHFFTTAEVERVLDDMAMQKLNTFHWHLTDDQGWRIEIKRYPKLTEVGAWRAGVGFNFSSNSTTAYGPDGRYGGFYTQQDVRDVVKYAASRHINVVPEIEMPGHSTAALKAYPEYSCTGGPFEPQLTAGIFDGIYDPAKEETYQFLENILAEVIPLFPYKYVHIGGDEVPKATWKKSADCQALMKREGLKDEMALQSWFTRRIERIVTAHGRTLIGWSEILEGGLPASATVMDWTGGAREAAAAGHDAVMTPTAYCYFDFYQTTNRAGEPQAATWSGPLPLNKLYSFEPMPTNLPPELQFHILGTQGNLWTEWIPNLKQEEYMMFPRACALAEIAWSSPAGRDWYDFMSRLKIEAQRLDAHGINYRRAALENPEPNPWPQK